MHGHQSLFSLAAPSLSAAPYPASLTLRCEAVLSPPPGTMGLAPLPSVGRPKDERTLSLAAVPALARQEPRREATLYVGVGRYRERGDSAVRGCTGPERAMGGSATERAREPSPQHLQSVIRIPGFAVAMQPVRSKAPMGKPSHFIRQLLPSRNTHP